MMDNDMTVDITSDLLNNLEDESGLIDLSSQKDFFDVLKFDRAIIYLLVDWSGAERASRYNIYNAFTGLDQKILPFFKIDCSDQQKRYVVDWLIGQKEGNKDFFYGGWGETLLIEKGVLIDFIRNPGKLGFERTKEKLKEWENNIHGKH